MYYQTMEVEGSLGFPIDMLRHDTCFPDRVEDASAISNSLHSLTPIRIRVKKITSNKKDFTDTRWAFFGWKVISKSEFIQIE